VVAGVDDRRDRVVRVAVGRIWNGFGLKPNLTNTLKISNDPQFIDKVSGNVTIAP
jgi:hypothetical protein